MSKDFKIPSVGMFSDGEEVDDTDWDRAEEAGKAVNANGAPDVSMSMASGAAAAASSASTAPAALAGQGRGRGQGRGGRVCRRNS